jgi:uncharacterized YccA/Bax inhibitor family protein
MATANPAANVDIYNRVEQVPATAAMTLQGTAIKTSVLVAIMVLTGGYAWNQVLNQLEEGGPGMGYGLIAAGALGGMIVAFITVFAPKVSPFTAPLYAALEGLVVGAVSAVYQTRYHGIVGEAISLSIGTLAVLLFLYASGIIRATENFKIGVVAATGGIFLVYMVDMILRLFGASVPFIHESGPVGIGISLVIVVVAALNLILDFDFIERGVEQGAPKYMEWYGGFSLLVTLVWMYLEMLRLLSKIRGSD